VDSTRHRDPLLGSLSFESREVVNNVQPNAASSTHTMIKVNV